MDLTNEDLLVLEEQAKKATPGPWSSGYKDFIYAEIGYEVCRVHVNHPMWEDQQYSNRQYIAAANPAVVLALINKVRELEQKNLKLVERVKLLVESF